MSNLAANWQETKPKWRKDIDSLEEQRSDSIDDISNKESTESFISTKFKHVRNHRQLDEVNLKEKINCNFLNKGWIIHKLPCSLHRKRLVKSNKAVTDKKLTTAFNAKWTVLCCNELLTSKPVVCHFYIYCDCKHKFTMMMMIIIVNLKVHRKEVIAKRINYLK